ncbi:MAG: PKD domain-containing protein [Pyrinomonadaceae bacterium]
MPVEQTWDGKYDADGKRKSPLKIALPFQTIETVNESVQDRKLDLACQHIYEVAGIYTILVKVIDIPGNDTTKTLQVEVE